MKTQARIGVVLGGISIAFSTLCLVVVPVFTPSFLLAALFGILSGGLAIALKARRTGIVAFAFALTPFCAFLLIEYVAERVQSGYVAFLPLVVALVIAIWALIDYSKAKRAVASTAN